ncbi:MAG TPA: hypothetical protein VMZ71_02235 [Gemmataceae bacterium]|nr:hypothetical protein [Gemmataceae bacterium]
MADPVNSRAVVQVADYPGLATNAGPMAGDAPGAAVEQTNLRSNVPGQIAARPGYRKIQFDEES